jgi:hypothetical protein
MKCADSARLLIGADPAASTPELEVHLADCPACARFRQEMRIFDADLRRAVRKPPVLGAAIEYLPYLDRGDVNGTD